MLVLPDNVPELRLVEEAICRLKKKYQRTDIELLSSQAVAAPSHKMYYTQVYEVFLDQLPPDWTKVIIPVTILSSYRRWIDAGFQTWHVTPDEHSHIIVVYLDRAKSCIYLLDPNNSFKLVGQKTAPHEDRKIFHDIVKEIGVTFQKRFSLPPFTIVKRALPSQDGYCGIVAMKVCEDIFMTEGKCPSNTAITISGQPTTSETSTKTNGKPPKATEDSFLIDLKFNKLAMNLYRKSIVDLLNNVELDDDLFMRVTK
jgi:hypothetical protein